MSLGGYLTGVLFAVLIWGSAVLVGGVVARRVLAEMAGAPRVLAGGLVTVAALVGFHLLPGSVGLLSREAVALTAVVVAAVAWRLIPARGGDRAAPAPQLARPDGLSIAIAAVAVAAVTAVSLAAFAGLATDAPTHVDALTFGLPGVAEWIRTGSLFEVGSFLPLFQVRTYPNTGDVLYLASILPFENDAFLRFTTLPLLAMTGLGVYGLGRELGAPASTSALTAALLTSMPAVAQPALTNIKPDVFMYATFTAGLVFLVRHARTRARSDLLLSGLGIGLAFGSRWYGISSAVVVLAVWALAGMLARRGLGRLTREGAILAATVLAVGGYWLVRNALLTGNPLYPARISGFGVTVFDAPRDVITEKLGFSIAERLGEPGLFSDHVLPGLRAQLSAPGLLLTAGTAAAAALAFRVPRSRAAAAVAALAAGALVLAGVYTITPASAQGFADQPFPGIVGETARWLVPALLAASGATAWALAQAGRLRPLFGALALVGVLVGLSRSYDTGAGTLAATSLALAALGFGSYLALRRSRAKAPRVRRRAALAVAAAVLVTLGGVGHLDQRRYNDGRFAAASPVSDWILGNADSGHRIGFAGGWVAGYVPIYAAFGPRYDNEVEYVGQVVDGQVHEYRRRSAFVAALRRGGYDLLVVGRVARPNLDRETELTVLDLPPEARWAAAVGFSEVVRDADFILLARDGRVSLPPRLGGS